MTFLWATVIPPKGMPCDLRREDGSAGQDPVGVGAVIATSGGGYAVKIVGDMKILCRIVTKKYGGHSGGGRLSQRGRGAGILSRTVLGAC